MGQVLAIKNKRRALGCIEHKPRAPVTPAVVPHGGNVSAVYWYVLPVSHGPASDSVLQRQYLRHPANGAVENVGIGQPVGGERGGLAGIESRNARQHISARCIHIYEARDVRSAQIGLNLRDFRSGTFHCE